VLVKTHKNSVISCLWSGFEVEHHLFCSFFFKQPNKIGIVSVVLCFFFLEAAMCLCFLFWFDGGFAAFGWFGDYVEITWAYFIRSLNFFFSTRAVGLSRKLLRPRIEYIKKKKRKTHVQTSKLRIY